MVNTKRKILLPLNRLTRTRELWLEKDIKPLLSFATVSNVSSFSMIQLIETEGCFEVYLSMISLNIG